MQNEGSHGKIMMPMPRRPILIVSGLAVLYAGVRIVPGLRREDLVFEEIDDPVGFRRLTAGKSSAGFDPFFGLEDRTENNQADAETRVRSNICASLYGDRCGAGEIVPVASFSDYYCPYCRVQTKRLAAIEARPGSGVRVAWHELPLLGETSKLAAKAALAARNQGAYRAFHERLMKSPFRATPEYLQALADDIGIDHAQLTADMNGERVLLDLENSAALARIFDFIGTPAMVIGRTVIQGEISERTIQDVVAREREEGWASVCQRN
ncbi:DsbA family protein [Roseovarius azorensis]|nr:DsbA family protein [Roseovarius azorensis]